MRFSICYELVQYLIQFSNSTVIYSSFCIPILHFFSFFQSNFYKFASLKFKKKSRSARYKTFFTPLAFSLPTQVMSLAFQNSNVQFPFSRLFNFCPLFKSPINKHENNFKLSIFKQSSRSGQEFNNSFYEIFQFAIFEKLAHNVPRLTRSCGLWKVYFPLPLTKL